MNIKITTAAMAMAFALTACGSEKKGVNTPNPELDNTMTADEAARKGFEKIETYGSFDVFYKQGGKTSVQLKGDDDDISQVRLKCDGRTLTISTKRGKGIKNNNGFDVDVYITTPRISGISINGSGDFKAESGINTGNMGMSISGSGDIELRSLKCDKCDTNIAGSGDIGIDGITAKKLTAKIAGSGDIDLSNADIARAELSIAGSGDIDIDGHVGSVSQHIAGSGTIDINP